MLKVTLGTLTTIFCITALIVIFYWRDIGFDPSSRDLFFFFVLIPVLATICILSPFYIMKWLDYRKEKAEQEQQRANVDFEDDFAEDIEPTWSKVSLYATSSLHAFGENTEIIDNIKNFLGPELDEKLTNQYGLPLVTYRIKDLEVMEEDEDVYASELQLRLVSLIQRQLENYFPQIQHIIEHIKKSTMFYDRNLAYEYKIHPAWINADYQESDEEVIEAVAEEVSKLSYLNVHIVFAEALVHSFDETMCSDFIQEQLFNLGILKQQIRVNFHYWNEQSAYLNYLNLLKSVDKNPDEISCIIVVDSEINQDIIDEKTFSSENYIPAEFTSSCLIASLKTNIENLLPEKTIHIVENEKNLINSLKYLNIEQSGQYEAEHPFVFILDSIERAKNSKKLNQIFAETAIESHHFLLPKLSLGHTQTLSDLWGGMLGMQTSDDEFNLVYSVKNYKNQIFILPYEQDNTLMDSE